MKNILFLVGMIFFVGCAVHKNKSNTIITNQLLLDEETFYIKDTTFDRTYGYKQFNPVRVANDRKASGPKNERRYLNALLGPNNEEIFYERLGSCCAFRTPNAPIENMGLLDRYQIYWKGCKDTLIVYINMYDKGSMKIPYGLKAKKNSSN